MKKKLIKIFNIKKYEKMNLKKKKYEVKMRNNRITILFLI